MDCWLNKIWTEHKSVLPSVWLWNNSSVCLSVHHLSVRLRRLCPSLHTYKHLPSLLSKSWKEDRTGAISKLAMSSNGASTRVHVNCQKNVLLRLFHWLPLTSLLDSAASIQTRLWLTQPSVLLRDKYRMFFHSSLTPAKDPCLQVRHVLAYRSR